MLKDMYDEGDDKMKEIIGNAMLKSREGKDKDDPLDTKKKPKTASTSSNNNSKSSSASASKLNTKLDLPEGLDDDDF